MSTSPPSPFNRFRSRLIGKADDVRERPVVYVAFGDSVTQGCMEYATLDLDAVYHAQVKRLIEQRYPRSVISVINAGVSGDTAHQSRARWERDLFGFMPDLVTIGFGVNDAHDGPSGLAAYTEALRELITSIRSRTEADILLITPTGMITSDNPFIHACDRPAVPSFLHTAEHGYLALYREAMLTLAAAENVPVLDAYQLWFEQARDGQDLHARLANGINHPDRQFHTQLAIAMAEKLLKEEAAPKVIHNWNRGEID
ncbi:SGNH/GDSL hydrolase family protein [Paenibacillus pectinilyticus]|uniref:SGNH/GDSL hydrolase family protein n=1 Tax=Paenibacillus pectinilyticus TaxID=512399 RepID=UPI001428A7FD|nr:GDSL-type esterase/lipase family protein [Paenibacillus pectinilyticus]